MFLIVSVKRKGVAMAEAPIKRALISVTDKTGIVEFAQALTEEFGIEVISTGGTAKIMSQR